MKKITNFFSIFLDETVFFVLASRVFSGLAGLVSIYFILKHLSLTAQAHYFTFINLAGFSVFFEFGLSTLIVQYVSHHIASFDISMMTQIHKYSRSSKKLFEFIRNVLLFSFILALLMFLFLNIIGLVIFKSDTNLLLPWVLFVFLIALNFILNTMLNIIEGFGRLLEVAKIRFTLALISIPVLWASLSFGLGVYSLSAQIFSLIIILLFWSLRKYRSLFFATFKFEYKQSLESFIKKISQLQYRLSVSFFSNYISTQAFVPIIFSLGYLELAGKFGLTLQILNALSGLAITWVNSKLALFGTSVAKGRLVEMKSEFDRLARLSLGILFLLLVIFWCIFFYLSIIKSEFLNRLLPANYLAIVSIAIFANHVYSCLNVYLLSFKKDTLFVLNVYKILFLIIGFGVLLSINLESGFIYLYFLSAIAINFLGSIYVFNKFNGQTTR